MNEIYHECGIAALCSLDNSDNKEKITEMMPQILLEMQNRGQLASGFASFSASRPQRLKVYKDIGTVHEVFHLSKFAKYKSIIDEYAGCALVGHTRYATCGLDDVRYAQPFERQHGRLWKWFTFAFNGNFANYASLRDELINDRSYNFTLDSDAELLMYLLARELHNGDIEPSLEKVMYSLFQKLDGAYNIVFMDAMGRMFVARDPLGLRPMSWAASGDIFAAASESSALKKAGFEDIRPLQPGQMIIIENGRMRIVDYVKTQRRARCFFEWVYFSNLSSVIDDIGVYQCRARLGQRLADIEDHQIDDECIVVPIPDTAKTAADEFAYRLKMRSIEGITRNRFVGRTFIQSSDIRKTSAKGKYMVIPDVLKGKKVFLVEDSLVRATTFNQLINEIRTVGEAKEIHVRVACPPIISPCYYGIDMSTHRELFAPRFLKKANESLIVDEDKMAKALHVDSLKYLSTNDIAYSLDTDLCSLCTGCLSGEYPTLYGNRQCTEDKNDTLRL